MNKQINQGNKIESPERDKTINGDSIYDKVGIPAWCRKDDLFSH